jgi:tRNA uridine 5-carboxymethylaminomethyl modification enzyme
MRILEQAEIQVKYSGYIDKERNADKLTRLEDVNSEDFDYHKIKSMTIEARQKLRFVPLLFHKHQESVGFLSDVSVLLIHMGR